MSSKSARLPVPVARTLRFSDPYHIYRRRALRLALAFPTALFIESQLLQLPQVSVLFGLFGCFSLTTMCDFGGPYLSRAIAYVSTVAIGWVSITLASAMSVSLWAAVISTLVYGFVVTYSGVLRGYFAAAVPGVFVGFFLAISSPNDWDNLGPNLIGWTVGTGLASAGGLLLWPMRTRDLLRHRIADAFDAMAPIVENTWMISQKDDASREREQRELTEAIAALSANYSGIVRRPGTTTGKQRYLNQLVMIIADMASSLQRTSPEKAHGLPGDSDLAAATAAALRNAAKVCRARGRGSPAELLDIERLNGSRENQLTAIEKWIADSAGTVPSLDIVVQVRQDMIIRRVASLTLMAVACLRTSTGQDPIYRGMGTVEGRQLLVRLPEISPWRSLWLNLTPKSIWFRNSVRAAVAYAISVAVILLTGLDHGFWIALGVMVALQADAAGTRSSIGRVLIGTVIGLVIGDLAVWSAHDYPLLLWLLLALAVALATYAPGASTQVVGQAAFTVFLMVLFALLLPGDQRATTEFRLIDVLVALVVTLVASVSLWPRGAAALVARSLADATVATGGYLLMGFRMMREGSNESVAQELAAADRHARQLYARAAENFDLATSQRVPNGIPADVWSRAAGAVVEALLEVDKVTFMARELDLGESFPRATASLESQSHLVASAWIESICGGCDVDVADYYPDHIPSGEPLTGLTDGLNAVVAQSLDKLVSLRDGRLPQTDVVRVFALIATVAALSVLEHSGNQFVEFAREQTACMSASAT